MKLYTYFRSSASFRVRIALGLKGLDWEAVFVNLREGEQHEAGYLESNPQGLIPALEVDGTLLTQSVAILEYLEEVCPEPALLPADAIGRARVRAMVQAVACDIHPLNNLRVLKYLKDPLGHDQQTIDTWYARWIDAGFSALERMVSPGDDGYCYGPEITMADIMLVPQMWNARRFGVDVEPYPRLCAIDARLQAVEAFRLAAPENQPDLVE